MFNRGGPIPILLFADSILGIRPYDWQCHILLNYEARKQTAAACANFTGKTSTIFPIAALGTLYSFPRARLMYLSATGAQLKNQFLASLERFRSRPAFAGWTWLKTEVRNPHGGFLFGRATDTSAISKAYTINPNLQPLSWLTKPNRSVTRSSMRSSAVTLLTGSS
jgi:hypothetical protein